MCIDRTLAALVVAALCLPLIPSTARAQSLPDGKGKDLVATACVKCHSLEMALSKRGTLQQWNDTVGAMIARGALISNDETATLAAYLSEHFGPTTAATSRSAPAPSAEGTGFVLPDGPGKDVLVAKCFQCHREGMWSPIRQDKQAWQGAIYRMVGRGALWTEDEIEAMADYLTRIRGPVPRGRP